MKKPHRIATWLVAASLLIGGAHAGTPAPAPPRTRVAAQLKALIQEAELIAQLEASARRTKDRATYDRAHHELLQRLEKTSFRMIGQIMQIMEDGALIRDARMPFKWKQRYVIDRNYRTIEGELRSDTAIFTDAHPVSAAGEPVFVLGAGKNKTDGDGWGCKVYPAGKYRYVTVLGSEKTVKCFALTAEDALRNMLTDR